MLIRDTEKVYKNSVKKAVGKNATADEILDYLFGVDDEYPPSKFVIRQWKGDTKTKTQRLNMFWAVPLTVVCMPFQYVVNGHSGWDANTAFGRWILKVTGHLEEM